MQFGFVPEKLTIVAVFILRRLHVKYHSEEKNCMFCGPGFDRVPRKVLEWVMMKKTI